MSLLLDANPIGLPSSSIINLTEHKESKFALFFFVV